MMTFKGPMKIYVDGVEMGEVTDCTFSTGADAVPEPPGGDDAEEEAMFLARAMFNQRLRPEAVTLSEGRPADDVLERMWERAQAPASPVVWVCRECALKIPDADLSDEARVELTHHLTGGGRCGPLQPTPLEPRLAAVFRECVASATALQVECHRLTQADYPAALEWFGDDEEDEDDEPALGSVSKKSSGSYEISVECKVPGGGLLRLSDAPKLTRALRTPADLDEYFGAGSAMAQSLRGALSRGPIMVADIPSQDGSVRYTHGRPFVGIDPLKQSHHDDQVDAMAAAWRHNAQADALEALPMGPHLIERLRVVQYLRDHERELRMLANRAPSTAALQYLQTANSLGARSDAIQQGGHITAEHRRQDALAPTELAGRASDAAAAERRVCVNHLRVQAATLKTRAEQAHGTGHYENAKQLFAAAAEMTEASDLIATCCHHGTVRQGVTLTGLSKADPVPGVAMSLEYGQRSRPVRTVAKGFAGEAPGFPDLASASGEWLTRIASSTYGLHRKAEAAALDGPYRSAPQDEESDDELRARCRIAMGLRSGARRQVLGDIFRDSLVAKLAEGRTGTLHHPEADLPQAVMYGDGGRELMRAQVRADGSVTFPPATRNDCMTRFELHYPDGRRLPLGAGYTGSALVVGDVIGLQAVVTPLR